MTLDVPHHVTSPAPASTLRDPPALRRQDPWPSTLLFSPSPGACRSPQQRSPKQCFTEWQSQRRTRCIGDRGHLAPPGSVGPCTGLWVQGSFLTGTAVI